MDVTKPTQALSTRKAVWSKRALPRHDILDPTQITALANADRPAFAKSTVDKKKARHARALGSNELSGCNRSNEGAAESNLDFPDASIAGSARANARKSASGSS